MLSVKRILTVAGVVVSITAASGRPVGAQVADETSCAAMLTEQLRRFSEECMTDLVAFVAAHPDVGARIYGEKDRFYVLVTRSDDGLLAHAVSKFNFPFMKDETAERLEQQGWSPPEDEADDWTKPLAGDHGAAAQEIGDALRAYGLQEGEALSLTVGPQVSESTPPA